MVKAAGGVILDQTAQKSAGIRSDGQLDFVMNVHKYSLLRESFVCNNALAIFQEELGF
jgi:hypothetical protein